MRFRDCLAGIALALILSTSAPAIAHEDHETAPASAPHPAGSPSTMPAMAGMAGDMDHAESMGDAAPRTIPQRVVRWLGAMHPAAVHFPIALFIVAALLKIAALTLRRPVLTEGTRVIIALAAVSAVSAAALGWFAMGWPGQDDATHTAHRWLGTSIALLGMICWWAKEHWVRRPGRAREWLYIGLLTTTAAAVLVNGLLGGMLTHGMRHLMF